MTALPEMGLGGELPVRRSATMRGESLASGADFTGRRSRWRQSGARGGTRIAASSGMEPLLQDRGSGTRELAPGPAQSPLFVRLYRARWLLGVAAAVACKASPPAADAPPSSGAEQGTTPVAAPGMQADEGLAGAAARGERPNVSDNMGRGFQGALQLRVRGAEGERGLRFFASGNKARIQIDGAEGANFDALVWDDQITTFDHERKSYTTVALDGIRAADEADVDVKREPTGERQTLQGVVCQPYRLEQKPYAIDTCVSGVPGDFDVDKFETVSAIDVPAWAESLLAEHLLPIQATVREGAREVYRIDLIQYSPPPIDVATLSVPDAYERRDPQQAAPR